MKRLYRNRRGAKLAGVCSGLGDYLDVDPVVIRLIFIVLAMWGGTGVILYIAAWVIVPEQPVL